MQIQDIFKKDINRNINGVIKAEQQDSESIYTELDEYVVTKELKKHFATFFDNYLAVLQDQSNSANNIGVWIAGFFGSGKSHFLKIISYLLENREVATSAHPEPRSALSFFEDKLDDPLMLANLAEVARHQTDAILFNIDSHAKVDDKEDAILNVFFKMFNEHIGYCGDYPYIAHFERNLDRADEYETFKSAFAQSAGMAWEDARHNYIFYTDDMVTALEATGRTTEASKKLVEMIEQSMVLNIDHFCEWVKEYLDDHPGKNVAFLVDEVGQFIGSDTSKMLKLQTIVEDLGVKCAGRAWVVVTSQANIDEALGYLDRQQGNDFSKIQGRFPTRISLSSSNTAEVIQKRLLEKQEMAIEPLTQIYQEKGDILRSQLAFDSGTTYKFEGFDNVNTFIVNYPFIPYHFTLVQSVFESIREKGATGKHLAMGERSLLNAFQSATRQLKDENLDVIVPFYRFYAPIEGFIEPVLKRVFDQALDNPALTTEDVDLLKMLFLIRYVDKLKSTLHNIIVLSIEKIDQDKKALGERIQASLERLESQMLIARMNDEFIFLTNEEKEIEQEIRKQEVSSADLTNELSKMIFDEILDGEKKIRHQNGQDFPVSRFCNGFGRDGQELNDLIFRVITPLDPAYLEYSDSNLMTLSQQEHQGVFAKLADDERLWKDIDHYVKTEVFLRQQVQNDRNRQLLADKKAENRERRQRILQALRESFGDAKIYSAGTELTDLPKEPKKRYSDSLNHYLDNTFKHLRTLKNLSKQPDKELQAILTNPDSGQLSLDGIDRDQLNQEAMNLIGLQIGFWNKQNERITVDKIIQKFSRKPYGWPDLEILILLARLNATKRILLESEGVAISGMQAYDKLTSPRNRATVVVREVKQNSEDEVRQVRDNASQLFTKPFHHIKVEDLKSAILTELQGLNQRILGYLKQSETDPQLPGREILAEGKSLIAPLLVEMSDYDFNRQFLQLTPKIADYLERFENVENFYENQMPLWREMKVALESTFKMNERHLRQRKESKQALDQLAEIYQMAEPYSKMHQVRPLIGQLKQINDTLLTQYRQKVLAKIERFIADLQQELDQIQAKDDLRNQVLRNIRSKQEAVKQNPNIDSISTLETEAKEAYDEGYEAINQYVLMAQRALEARKQVKTSDTTAVNAGTTESTQVDMNQSDASQQDSSKDLIATTLIGAVNVTEAEQEAVKDIKVVELVDPRALFAEVLDSNMIENEAELQRAMRAIEAHLQQILASNKRIRIS